MICASRGSDLKFDRSYNNWEEGVGVCCWDAPTKEALEELFNKAGTPFERILPVEEHVGESLVT